MDAVVIDSSCPHPLCLPGAARGLAQVHSLGARVPDGVFLTHAHIGHYVRDVEAPCQCRAGGGGRGGGVCVLRLTLQLVIDCHPTSWALLTLLHLWLPARAGVSPDWPCAPWERGRGHKAHALVSSSSVPTSGLPPSPLPTFPTHTHSNF